MITLILLSLLLKLPKVISWEVTFYENYDSTGKYLQIQGDCDTCVPLNGSLCERTQCISSWDNIEVFRFQEYTRCVKLYSDFNCGLDEITVLREVGCFLTNSTKLPRNVYKNQSRTCQTDFQPKSIASCNYKPKCIIEPKFELWAMKNHDERKKYIIKLLTSTSRNITDFVRIWPDRPKTSYGNSTQRTELRKRYVRHSRRKRLKSRIHRQTPPGTALPLEDVQYLLNGQKVEILWEYRRYNMQCPKRFKTIMRYSHIRFPRTDFDTTSGAVQQHMSLLHYVTGDQHGHIIASILNGVNSIWNLSPQAPTLNLGNGQPINWKTTEMDIAKYLELNPACHAVTWELTIEYLPNSNRPHTFEIFANYYLRTLTQYLWQRQRHFICTNPIVLTERSECTILSPPGVANNPIPRRRQG
jgi:hypothetical protein